MKVSDIDRVNHLVTELTAVKALIGHTERAEPADCEMFVRLPGDASIKLSGEGSSSSHYEGVAASPAFLGRLKLLAIEELDTKRRGIIAELAGLGVEAEA